MNWYKIVKLAQVQGEYWIDDSGSSMYADGDIGDMTHEGHVIQLVQHQIVELHENADKYDNYEWIDWDQFISDLGEEGENEDEEQNVLEWMRENGVSDDDYAIAYGMLDAREYAIKKWGWKRLQGNNVETWTLTPRDLNSIARGLWDAYDNNVESETFNIYVYSNEKWFNDISWEVIDKGDVSALQQYVHVGW